MALKLPDHSHCLNCGDPLQYGKTYCDSRCEEQHAADTKRTNVKDFAFYAGVAVILVVIVYAFIL